MKALYITLIFGITFIQNLFAQQEFQMANTPNNPYLLNPAAGGLTDILHLELNTRLQWLGYDGGPKTVLLAGNTQIGGDQAIGDFNTEDELMFKNPKISVSKSKHVVGGKVWYDGIGPFSKTSLQGTYAYHLPMRKGFMAGVGMGLGWSNFGLNSNRVVLYQADDANYNQFLGTSSNQNFLDAQTGLVIYNSHFFFGLSATQMFKNQFKPGGVETGSNFNTHFFLVTKYRFQNKESDFGFEPTLVIKMAKNVKNTIDFGAKLWYLQSAWFGMQYRTSNNLVFQAGSNLLKNFYVSYAFELGVGKIRNANNGTHEFQVGYYFGRNRNLKQEIKEK